jgi:4-diphosphocytidyl-2-C-methyl-D-erythritol kinase
LTPQTGPTKKFSFTNPLSWLWNAFEEVVFQEFPLLRRIQRDALNGGAKGCVMSGSGSSLVAFFDSVEEASLCAGRFRGLKCACHAVRSGQEVFLES